MPKQYKADCTAHDDCELISFVGEDLAKFKKRMVKQGHTVGELKNSARTMSEKGYLILSDIQNWQGKLNAAFEALTSEYDTLDSAVDVGGITPLASPIEVEKDEIDLEESEGSE